MRCQKTSLRFEINVYAPISTPAGYPLMHCNTKTRCMLRALSLHRQQSRSRSNLRRSDYRIRTRPTANAGRCDTSGTMIRLTVNNNKNTREQAMGTPTEEHPLIPVR